MKPKLTIGLDNVKHPEQKVRGLTYLFNMTETEREKAQELMEKYNLNMRQLLSTLISNAK